MITLDGKSVLPRDSQSESLPRSLSGTLPKKFGETRLLTKVKVAEDDEELAKRRKLIVEYSPAQLAQMSSVADLPLPRPLEHFLKSDKKAKEGEKEEGTKR